MVGGLSESGEVYRIVGSCRGLGSRGCLVAIHSHIHGVLTPEGACGSRRGEWCGFWLRRGDWSSPAFPGEGIVVAAPVGEVGGGGWTTPRDGLLVSSLRAGGALAAMGPTSIMNCAIWARRVLLGASGRCVSVSIAIGALGVAVGLDDFFDLVRSEMRKLPEMGFPTSSGSTEKTTESAFLDSLES